MNFVPNYVPSPFDPTTGQIYFITNPSTGAYYLTPMPIAPTAIQAPPPPPPPPKPEPQVVPKDVTNAKIKNIKQKCVIHYIDGQLIIEKAKKQIGKTQPTIQKHQSKPTPHQPTATPALPAPPQITPQAKPVPPPVHQAQPAPSRSSQPAPSRSSQPVPSRIVLNREESGCQKVNFGSDINQLRSDMIKWPVSRVVEFIASHENIADAAPKFSQADMDGEALLLLIDSEPNARYGILEKMSFTMGRVLKISAVLSKYRINN